jgi:DNA-binding MarR family transcriptional regulator
MASELEVLEVQTLYPRIYMACHTEHVRAASSAVRLSSRDSAILAHLSVPALAQPTRLARHLKIGLSTLSAATSRLAGLGYLRSERDPEDERRQILKLTPEGQAAMKASSVLDSAKVARLLSRLTPSQRKKAIAGLALLAGAASGG